MKIVLIITSLGMGGAERQVCDLIDLFVKKGHDVLLICLTGEILNRPQSSSVTVVSLNMRKTLFGLINSYLKARKLIKKFNADIIHSHMVHANLFARLLRLSVYMKKLICTAHSSNEGGKLRMLAYKLTDNLCDLNTNVSEKAVNISIKRGATKPNRIIAVYNGIDTSKFQFNSISRIKLRSKLGLTEDTSLILSVGRLTEAKDYPTLLTSFSQLLVTKPNSLLAIIGIGEELVNLRSIVSSLGINNKVLFLGLSNNVNGWMCAADIFVLSSAWEGFGLVVAEAMACEKVVVATDCGGVKEIVGEYGYLVPPKNPYLLSKSMSYALSLPNDKKLKIGASARRHIQLKFSIQNIVDKWLSIYNS